MSDSIKLVRALKELGEIKIDRSQLIEPFDANYMSPLLKVHLFLELLAKAEESFDYIAESENAISYGEARVDYEVDEDGIVIPDPKETAEYELKMKPMRDCEEFVKEYPFNYWDLIGLMQRASKHALSAAAREKAYKRLENDPKQHALDEILNHYEAQKHQFKRRGYSAQFVRDMNAKYPIITSIKTIEKLVATLNKENDAIPR